MTEIILFGGTAEGRELAGFLGKNNINSIVSVVSSYGGSLVSDYPSLKVRTGILLEKDMRQLFKTERPDLIIDATHPYAASISSTIKTVSTDMGIDTISIYREGSSSEGYICFDSLDEMISYLNTRGKGKTIYSTLGAKASEGLSKIHDYENRVFTRILPLEKSLHMAIEAGLSPGNITCMQGPFSEELNEAMFRHTGAEILLTKDSGKAGGFPEKVKAAEKLGMEVLILRRPETNPGITVEEAEDLILKRVRDK